MRPTALACALAFAVVLALPLRAAAGLEVVASIAPVHSLVARVMQGAGAPYLLLPPGSSPHDYALRPSGAAALERAALVFWVGPRLERRLERPLTTLAAGARVVRLADTPGLIRLALRRGAAFAESGEAHGEDETDPHLWLDPENAKLWLGAIAAALAGADPEHRALYLANADAAQAELDALAAEIDTRLAPIRGRPFVVFHDSFHYFEHRFGIEAAGAVALGDARAPGPARIARIRDLFQSRPQLRSTRDIRRTTQDPECPKRYDLPEELNVRRERRGMFKVVQVGDATRAAIRQGQPLQFRAPDEGSDDWLQENRAASRLHRAEHADGEDQVHIRIFEQPVERVPHALHRPGAVDLCLVRKPYVEIAGKKRDDFLLEAILNLVVSIPRAVNDDADAHDLAVLPARRI